MKKALFISNLLPNKFEPNRGIFTFRTVQEIAKLCEVKIIAPYAWHPLKKIEQGNSYISSIPEKENIEGLDIFHPGFAYIPKITLPFNGASYFLSLSYFYKKHFYKYKPDFILSSWIYPDGYASMYLARLLKIPFFVLTHGSDVNSLVENKFTKNKIVKVVKKAEKVFFPSREMIKKITTMVDAPQKMFLKPFGVDTDRFKPVDKELARQKVGIEGGKKVVLFVGNLEKIKGINFLIEAISMLEQSHLDDLRCVIVGGGTENGNFKKIAEEKNLGNAIEFVGKKKNEEIPFWINASDMVCLPSLSEGCPNILIEALSCGVPVIASAVGEIPYLIKEGTNGYTFPPKSPSKIKDSIVKSINQTWEKDKITDTVSGNDWENSAKMILNEILKSI